VRWPDRQRYPQKCLVSGSLPASLRIAHRARPRRKDVVDEEAYEDRNVKGADALKPYAGNARTHSDKQISQIEASIRKFGFNNPVLVDADNRIVAGHGRVEAAKRLGLRSVPTIRLDHLSDAERRAYVIAGNRLAELAGWDREILKIELQGLADLELDFEIEITGSGSARPDATGRMSGSILASIPSGTIARTSLPCTRRSSPSRSWLTPSRTYPDAAISCSMRLADHLPPVRSLYRQTSDPRRIGPPWAEVADLRAETEPAEAMS
jgi:ParB-like nuclease domain